VYPQQKKRSAPATEALFSCQEAAMQTPSIGRAVHYVSFGTPKGEFKPAHRAATITDVFVPVPGDGEMKVRLCVMNPTGLFFTEWLSEDPTGETGGTWHWPEFVPAS